MQAFVSLQLGPSEPPQISVVPAVLVDPTEEWNQWVYFDLVT